MILTTFDKKEIYVTREQAEKIQAAINRGAKMLDLGKSGYIAASAVATILPGGEKPERTEARLPERAKLSPEQEAAKRERGLQHMANIRKTLEEKGIMPKA